jgi:preprotein translocase SecE subunit
MIVGVLVAFYASASWFRWQPFSGVFSSDSFLSVDFVIAVVLLAGLCGFFAWVAFRASNSGDYLIDMDDELRKVVWPSVMPLFDPKTEAWGSTYVVIVCAILFTIFVGVADVVLQLVITDGIFGLWLFA